MLLSQGCRLQTDILLGRRSRCMDVWYSISQDMQCCFKWPINSYNLIWASNCVLDTMIGTIIWMRWMKHFFMWDWVVKDASCCLRNELLIPRPHQFLWFILRVRCCSVYIHDVYVDWNISCIKYSPKCCYGHLWDFIWQYTPSRYLMFSQNI